MAEEKPKLDKGGDKKGPPKKEWHVVEVIVILLLFLFILGAASRAVSLFASKLGTSDITFYGIHIFGIFSWLKDNSFILKFFSFAFSFGAFGFAVYFSRLKGAILIAERAKLFPEGLSYPSSSPEAEPAEEMKRRWQKILDYSSSTIESDWRVAIIEADIILEELLSKLNLPGDTIGERMKAVERSDFTNIDAAWEAHKYRNMISHEAGAPINQREVRRIISLYELVFKEFYLI